MGTEYFIALEGQWCPADSPIRNTHSGNTRFDTHVLNRPNQKHLLFWQVNGRAAQGKLSSVKNNGRGTV